MKKLLFLLPLLSVNQAFALGGYCEKPISWLQSHGNTVKDACIASCKEAGCEVIGGSNGQWESGNLLNGASYPFDNYANTYTLWDNGTIYQDPSGNWTLGCQCKKWFSKSKPSAGITFKNKAGEKVRVTTSSGVPLKHGTWVQPGKSLTINITSGDQVWASKDPWPRSSNIKCPKVEKGKVLTLDANYKCTSK